MAFPASDDNNRRNSLVSKQLMERSWQRKQQVKTHGLPVCVCAGIARHVRTVSAQRVAGEVCVGLTAALPCWRLHMAMLHTRHVCDSIVLASRILLPIMPFGNI